MTIVMWIRGTLTRQLTLKIILFSLCRNDLLSRSNDGANGFKLCGAVSMAGERVSSVTQKVGEKVLYSSATKQRLGLQRYFPKYKTDLPHRDVSTRPRPTEYQWWYVPHVTGHIRQWREFLHPHRRRGALHRLWCLLVLYTTARAKV